MALNNFYTVRNPNGTFTAYSRSDKNLSYGPKKNRDTALSGIKRLAKKVGVNTGATSVAATVGTKPTSSKVKVNRITLLLDCSGSMRSILRRAVDALNQNIETIREQARQTGQVCRVTVVLFNTRTRIIRNDVLVQNLQPIGFNEASEFSGGTALLDAVGESITNQKNAWIPAGEDVSYLVMTVTDGQELDSTRFTADSLGKLMKQVQGTDRWTLTFLVPAGDKYALCRNFQIPDGNVSEWEQSEKGIERYQTLNAAGIGTYFNARSNGQTSTKAFYQTDLSGLSTREVKSKLDDISGNVRALQVDREMDIRSFVEKKLGSYAPGSAFYQLTKDEKEVQGYKQLLVKEKGKKAVFGGPDARAVLGIPNQDLKIKPGNHANFDIFVQSTSNNRKLVRGTQLLVKVS